MWAAEKEFVSSEFVRVGSSLTITEMLRCGVTCVNDMYFFPDVTASLISGNVICKRCLCLRQWNESFYWYPNHTLSICMGKEHRRVL